MLLKLFIAIASALGAVFLIRDYGDDTLLLVNSVLGLITTNTVLAFLAGVLLVWGVNFVFWGFVGFVRAIDDAVHGFLKKKFRPASVPAILKREDVAIVVPAHNEELVIEDTLKSLQGLVPLSNLHVVSDGSSDSTVELVKRFNVKVLNLIQSRGKAGALEACIKHFDLLHAYKAVLFVDADTRLQADYLDKALPYFNDPGVIAVAGYAKTIWNPDALSAMQALFLLHRDRIYFLSQMFLKFGQSWKYTNTTHIVPGFASVYRTSALEKITINPPGLVIEDFNMTFEVHHKHLGTIAHHPSIVAYTQDPDNPRDYFKQIKRWHLGLWQTIRYHGMWPSKFWASFFVVLFEAVFGSIVFLFLPILAIAWLLPAIGMAIPSLASNEWLGDWYTLTHVTWLIPSLFVSVWTLDYIQTLVVAIGQRRPEYLLIGLAFPFLRFIDAIAFLYAIPRAFGKRSSGRWVSPTRRAN